MTGVDAIVPFRGSVVTGKVALAGVIGDVSGISAVMTDRLRILRLEDDMFFLSKSPDRVVLLKKRAGDSGIGSSPSWVPVLVKAGVAGDSLCIELPEWMDVNGVRGSTWVARGTGGLAEEPAWVVRISDDSIDAMESSFRGEISAVPTWFFFAREIDEFRECVSILSFMAFCPDSRRSLTPGPGEAPKLGDRGGGGDGVGGRGGGGAEVGGSGRAPAGGGCGGGSFGYVVPWISAKLTIEEAVAAV